MVGPVSTTERQSQLTRLKVGVALLVGISMALVSLQGGASLPVLGGAFVAGTVLGGVLAWYVLPDADSYMGRDDSREFRK